MADKQTRILFIHNKYLHSGGEDTVVVNEIETLKRNNYRVYYKEYSNISFNKFNLKSLAASAGALFNFLAFIKIYFFVRKNKIDVVHVHNFFYRASPSVFWAAKAARARTVMTLHNYRLFCLNAFFFRDGNICFDCHTNGNFKKGIAEKCFKGSGAFSSMLASSTMLHRNIGTWKNKIDKFIVINHLMEKLLADIGVEENKIIFKPNFKEDTGHSNYTTRQDFYLFAGRLQEEKGIRHLVEAFRKMNKKIMIAGDGELAPFVRSNISENIMWEGYQPKEELSRLLLNCRAFVFPSLLLEGMPMTIIEARSAGTIPIAARSVNTEAMILDGVDGFLYEAGNIESLIKVIDTFESKTSNELDIISEKSRKRFLHENTEIQHLNVMKEVYSG